MFPKKYFLYHNIGLVCGSSGTSGNPYTPLLENPVWAIQRSAERRTCKVARESIAERGE